MATVERNTLLATKRENNDLMILYPITTTENVEGLSDEFAPKGHTHSTVNGHTVECDVPKNAKFTDTTYGVATSSANGLMSSADKSKLDSGYVVKKDTTGLYIEI